MNQKSKQELAKQDYMNTTIGLVEVCKKYQTDPYSFSQYLKSQGIKTNKKSKVDTNLFRVIDSEESAYWLGFLYADGSIMYRNTFPTVYSIELGLANKDRDHLEKFCDYLNICHNSIKYRKSTNSDRVIISSKEVVENIINLGCKPKKSLTLTFPTKEQVPEEYINSFMRGYFDGDGCLSLKGERLVYCSILGTKEFLEEIMEIYNIPQDRLKKDSRHKNNTYSILFNVKQSFNFLEEIYKNANICLDRKYSKYIIAVSNRNARNNQGSKTVKAEMLIPC